MLPQYYRQQRPVRSGPMRVAEVGKGDYYLTRENSPYSLALDDGLAGFSIKKAFSSVTKPFSSAVSSAFRIGAKAATVGMKITTAPLRMGTALYAKTGLPGSTVLTKLSTKALNLVEQIPASQIGYTAAVVRAPFVLAKGVTTGNIMESFKQVEKEVRVGGGKPLSALVKVGKIVVPAVLTYIIPPVGIAISAAIIARDIYVAKRESAAAKRDYDNKMASAYQTYVNAVGEAGFTPAPYSVFSGWVNAGGEGELPLGARIAQPGDDPGGQYATTPAAPDNSSSIVPLIIIGAAAALGEAPSVAPIVNPPAPPQSTSIVPWLMLGIAILKK